MELRFWNIPVNRSNLLFVGVLDLELFLVLIGELLIIGVIEEHYPGVLLGTNALKTLITIKYIKYKIYAHLYKNMVTLLLTLNSIFKFLSFDIYTKIHLEQRHMTQGLKNAHGYISIL